MRHKMVHFPWKKGADEIAYQVFERSKSTPGTQRRCAAQNT